MQPLQDQNNPQKREHSLEVLDFTSSQGYQYFVHFTIILWFFYLFITTYSKSLLSNDIACH